VLATATVVGDRYVLGPVIGRGGGADVFRAEDTRTGRPVAVKVLRSATTDDLRRFELEAETLSRLDHPAIVRMCDRGDHDGVPYLVLDLVDGEPLSDVVRRSPLAEDDVVRIGAVLAGALAHAHALGVVHRDVKPGNVLFDAVGDVHLTDFGIARLTDASAITSSGFVVGTAAYLAPEQVNGEGAQPPSDVYALGLVLIEALTGSPAFTGPSTEAALARPQRAPEVPETTSPSLAPLLTSMTAMEPEARPTAAGVVDALSADRTMVLPVAADVTEAIPIEPVVLAAASHRELPWGVIAVAGVAFLLLLGWLTGGSSGGSWYVSTGPTGPAAPPPTTPVTAPPPTTVAVAPATVPPEPAPKHGKKKGG
jgi:serine/threonine protein kinase